MKPYVKQHKNDATDAEAICEAVTRPNMRFVATKTPQQQSGLTLHRTRHLFIRQQTAVINVIRALFAEFGIVGSVGRNGVEQLLSVATDANDKRLPEVARACVIALGAQLQTLKAQILEFDRMIRAWHRSNEASRRLDVIPGVGPVLATALVASIADPKAFRSGRDFSAWIGLVPKQASSGGKDRLGSISKRGDRYLRSLFTTGALWPITSLASASDLVAIGGKAEVVEAWSTREVRRQMAGELTVQSLSYLINLLFPGLQLSLPFAHQSRSQCARPALPTAAPCFSRCPPSCPQAKFSVLHRDTA